MDGSGRPVVWVGSSRRDLRGFPREVRRDLGQALYAAQQGEADPAAKPLRGFGGALYLKLLPIRKAALGALSIPSAIPRPCMSYTPSRRNPKAASLRQSGTW